MFYSKQLVCFNRTTLERRVHNNNTAKDITDINIYERITKFQYQLKNEFVYRVPLRYFLDINRYQRDKMDRIKCHLETDMKNLFELKKKVSRSTRCKIFTRAPFLQ